MGRIYIIREYCKGKVFVKNDDYIFSEKDIFSIINGDSYFCKNLSELENNIIASAILCSMPRENLEKFCKNLIHSYNYIKAIKPLFKYNCKIYEILFELFRWGISGRSETHYREILQDFDWIVSL